MLGPGGENKKVTRHESLLNPEILREPHIPLTVSSKARTANKASNI